MNSLIRSTLFIVSMLFISTGISDIARADLPNVFFVSPQNGATVTSPLKIEMGVKGYTVGAAGEIKEGVGHHHIILDGGPIAKGEIVPTDPRHIHFGKGQTETSLSLPPGKHTLTLQFADGAHRSYGPELSATIEVLVK